MKLVLTLDIKGAIPDTGTHTKVEAVVDPNLESGPVQMYYPTNDGELVLVYIQLRDEDYELAHLVREGVYE